MYKRIYGFMIVLFTSLLLTGCNEEDIFNGVTNTTSKELVSIQITPTTVNTKGVSDLTVITGLTQSFAAIGTYLDGSNKDISHSVLWSSSETAVATMKGQVLTGLTDGKTQVFASQGGVSSNFIDVNVVSSTLIAIQVTPADSTIAKGNDVQLTAQGVYSYGLSVDITSSVAWVSSDTNILTVTAAGLATGVKGSTAPNSVVTVIASKDSINSNAVDINVMSRMVKTIYSNYSAFAALKTDGTVVTWGHPDTGGDSSSVADQLIDVKTIYSTINAFAAVREDGTVVTWGSPGSGGDSSSVAVPLIDVKTIYSSRYAFAALTTEGKVVTWGCIGLIINDACNFIQNSVPEPVQLKDVESIYATETAFAALKTDGTVVTWGGFGGDSSSVAAQLKGVETISSNGGAFAALKTDGTVVTWGINSGSDSSTVSDMLVHVKTIYSNQNGFSALKLDGTVVTWGLLLSSDSSETAQLKGVKSIYSNDSFFVALTTHGTVGMWGADRWLGPDPSPEFFVPMPIPLKDVETIYANNAAFAALTTEGKVVTWGNTGKGGNHIAGGDSSSVTDQLVNVKTIYSNYAAFAALKENGTVVTWGSCGGCTGWPVVDGTGGGNSSSVTDQLIDVKTIYSSGGAFAALKHDGTVVTWGSHNGGDSSGVDWF